MRLFKDYITKIVSLPIVLLTNIYLAVLGISWLSIHMYFRFCISRPEYTLVSLKPYITNYHLGLAAVFIIMHFVILIIALHNLYRRYTIKQSTFKIIPYLQKRIDYLYWKPLEYIHDIIAPDLPYSGMLIAYITEYLERGHQKLRYKLYRHCYIVFDYLPKLLVSSIFFIDIVILNQIHYFLYSVWLLLIPIIYKIYIKLCSSFVTRNEPDLLEILDIKPQSNPDENGIYIEIFSMKAKYISDALVLEETVNNYIMLRRITLHINAMEGNSAKYDPYILLVTSGIYLSAAVYRLIYILL